MTAPEPCEWSEDCDGNWFTACDEAFTFTDGGPAENGMRYCCYCGGPLVPVLYEEAAGGMNVADYNTTTDKLQALLARCKCGVYLTVNKHRDVYETASRALDELANDECPPDIADDVRAEMIARDTIIELHFYPDTPIGSYLICHYDLDAALDESLRAVNVKEGT